MTIVVDASIAAKWVLPEGGSDRAVALRESDDELIAPSLIVAEIGNTLWKRAMRKEVSASEAAAALEIAAGIITRLIPLPELVVRASELAIALRHPIYDCFYLALAERERCAVVSADRKLLAAAKGLKGLEARSL